MLKIYQLKIYQKKIQKIYQLKIYQKKILKI